MPAARVRADYEQLASIAQAFGRQAESAQRTLGALQSSLNTLQHGDWVGKGADAFYAEMNSAVLPAMKRLVAAMTQASNTTARISRIMKQAEHDAAALFKAQRGGVGGNAGFAGASGRVSGAAGRLGGRASVARSGGGVLSKIGGFFKSAARHVGDFFVGAGSELLDMVKGIGHMVTHPLQTLKGLAYAVTHPRETWEALKKPYVDAWNSGHPGQAIGRGFIFVASFFVGAGEAKTAAEVGKVGEVAGTAGKLGEVGKVGEVAGTAGKLGEAGRVGEVASGAGKAGRVGEAAGVAGRGGEAGGAARGAVAAQEAELAEMAKAGQGAKAPQGARTAGEAAEASKAGAVQPILRTGADPLRKYGAAMETHPEEFARIQAEVEKAGGTFSLREGGNMGYSPTKGQAGTLIFDSEASIGALRHEYQHFLDDMAHGYPGLGHYLENPHLMYQFEQRAYEVEIGIARQLNDAEAVEKLTQLMNERRIELLGG